MDELVNYGMDEEERAFVIRCLRDMGNHYHNLEREIREDNPPYLHKESFIERFNKDATACVLIADKIEAGCQLVVTNYPPEAVDHDTTM